MTLRTLLPHRRLAALVLTGCGFGVNAAAADHVVPLKVTVRTQEVLRLDPATCPTSPFLAGATVGVGTASSPLGLVSLLAGDCIMPGGGSFMFGNGKLTLTTATGERLTATYSGSLLPIADAALPVRYTISGTVTITGGTGRFVGASGSGHLGGTENLLTGQGQFEVNATLSY